VSGSGTALVPKGSAGKGEGCEPRRIKGEPVLAVDQGGKKERGQASKGRDEKRTGSRKDSSHDETQKARETADKKDLADDKADKREYAALKNKMEARRIAREIQTAHDTLAALRAEQDSVSGKTETVAKTRSENDRPGTGVAIAAKTAIKKSRVTRPVTGTVVSESEVNAAKGINRRAGESEKTKSAEIERGEQEDTSRAPQQTAVKTRMKKTNTATEPSRTATGEIVVQSSGDESVTEILGPALVAGALGRKIGDARTANTMRGITECRVELLSTRQKAKLPVPKVPNNSAESNSVTEIIGTSDARLSLSATDMQVELELPGDVSEEPRMAEVVILETEKGRIIGGVGNTEPRRIPLMPVASRGKGVASFDDIDRLARVAEKSGETVRAACADDKPIPQKRQLNRR